MPRPCRSLPLRLLLGIAWLAFSLAMDAYDLIDKASAFAEKGQLQRSLGVYMQVVTTDALLQQLPKPHQSQVFHNLGFTYQQLGDMSNALVWLDKSTRLAPSEQAHSKAAFCANSLGQTGRAAAHLEAAIKLGGSNARPHLFLYHGELLNNLKRQQEAVATFQKGLKAIGRAVAAGGKGKGSGAGNSKSALLRHPSPELKLLAARLHHGMGDALLNLGDAAKALQKLEAAIEFVDAASSSAANRDPPEAKEERRRLRVEVLASAAEARRQLVDWRGYEERTQSLLRGLKELIAGEPSQQSPPPVTPYSALTQLMEPALRAQLSSQWLASQAAASTPATESQLAALQKRLEDKYGNQTTTSTGSSSGVVRLGIISRRFHHYPGTHLMLGLFKRFDRRRVHVSCYATGPDSSSGSSSGNSTNMSAERARLAMECDSFHDLSVGAGATAEEVAGAILSNGGVHALFDYDGAHDFNNQRAIALLSALASAEASGQTQGTLSAPVIVSWLGFAGPVGYSREGSIGSRSAGYSAVDRVIAPPETVSSASSSKSSSFPEALLYLPHTYQPQDPEQGGNHLASPASDEEALQVREAEGLTNWWAGAAQAGATTLQLPAPDADMPLPDVEPTEEGNDEGQHADSQPQQENASALSPRSPFVLASFNRLTKLEPTVFNTWMNALSRCGDHCVLWLYGGGGSSSSTEGKGGSGNSTGRPCEETMHFRGWPVGNTTASRGNADSDDGGLSKRQLNVWLEAASRGVHPSRIVFACKAPRGQHLRRLSLGAAVQLDSRVYGAHTTASDGLYGGVPLVTMPSFPVSNTGDEEGGLASRVGASLLRSLAGPHAYANLQAEAAVAGETHSLASYEEAVVAMAAAAGAPAAELKKRITARVMETRRSQAAVGADDVAPPRAATAYRGLFDAFGFASSLERSSRALHELQVLQRHIIASGEHGNNHHQVLLEQLPGLVSQRLMHVVVAASHE